MESRRVEQHFGNLEAADGSLAVQANISGPLHIHRKLSKALQRHTIGSMSFAESY